MNRSPDVKHAIKLLSSIYVNLARDRLVFCKRLIANDKLVLKQAGLNDAFEKLELEDRNYFISSFYMLLMPKKRRRRLAAFFTPPHLCNFVLERAISHGLKINDHRIIDPACGGAAFLVPLATRYLTAAKTDLASAHLIQFRLFGIEIDPGLATLSNLLIADQFERSGIKPIELVTRSNSLKPSLQDSYDAAIANPPYGRVFRASEKLLTRWACVISEGHVNTYSLFIALAIELTKAGGLIAVIVPTSFTAGPYFCKLRSHILSNTEVLEIDLIEKRADQFIDVIQDTCIMLMRKSKSGSRPLLKPVCRLVKKDEVIDLGEIGLPASGNKPWVLPRIGSSAESSKYLFSDKTFNLSNFGYEVACGYFVWNRSKGKASARLLVSTSESGRRYRCSNFVETQANAAGIA